MGQAKGTGLVYVRHRLKNEAHNSIDQFFKKLTEEEKKRFHIITHVSMVPIELVVKYCEEAALVLYPGLPQDESLLKLNFDMAQDQMTGIYKILLKFATPEYVINQTAKIWSTIHSQGKAYSIKEKDGQGATFYIEGYPDLPKRFFFMVKGYISGVLALVHVKNLHVTIDDTNSAKWAMHFKWNK